MSEGSFATAGASRGQIPVNRSALLMLTAAFALFVFLIFTLRASLNPDDPMAAVRIDKRIVATAIGASIYWLTLQAVSKRLDQSIGDIFRVSLQIVIMGAIILLLARLAIDTIHANELETSILNNARWLLIWLGYFATWVAGFVAHAYYSRWKSIAEATATSERLSAAEEEVLAAQIIELAGYECADPVTSEDFAGKANHATVLRLLARQSASAERSA